MIDSSDAVEAGPQVLIPLDVVGAGHGYAARSVGLGVGGANAS